MSAALMIHYGVPDAEYRAWGGYSQSFLKTVILRSPAHAMLEKKAKRDSAEMLEGRAFHALLLEREQFAKRYYVARKLDKRSSKPLKSGGRNWTPWELLQLRADPREIIWRETARDLNRMIRSIHAHAMTAELLCNEYQTEVSMKWIDEDTGLYCKGRADIVIPSERIIIDPKRTTSASPAGFARTAVNLGYAIQAAFYADAMQQLTGEPWLFLFLAVEPTPPYAVGLYELDAASLNDGRAFYKAALKLCQRCEQTKRWPAYSDYIETLSLPPWNRKIADAAESATYID